MNNACFPPLLKDTFLLLAQQTSNYCLQEISPGFIQTALWKAADEQIVRQVQLLCSPAGHLTLLKHPEGLSGHKASGPQL